MAKVYDLRFMGGSQWARLSATALGLIWDLSKNQPTLSNEEIAFIVGVSPNAVRRNRNEDKLVEDTPCETCGKMYKKVTGNQKYCMYSCNPRSRSRKGKCKGPSKKVRRIATLAKYSKIFKEIW